MSDRKLTKEVYLQYAKKIVSVLSGDEFFEQYKKRVDSGFADFKLVKKRLIQDISVDWIATIEEVLPNLDTIVRNPRKFIVQEEDIVDISLCKAISTESVKHLAQHTNMISKVDKDGTVTPSRILNITKEESFEIYENRFIYTLLLKLKDFVSMRYDKIKAASATQDVLQLNVDSKFNLPSKKVTYRTEYMAQLSFDEVMRMDQDTLEKIERIAKIDKIITDFLGSSFAKAMRNSAPVRPPITRTNVILKEPNFKKALTLWQFVETYQATGGFSTADDIEDYKISPESDRELHQMVTLNTMLFESLYDQHETDMDLSDAEFTDLLKIGDLDFAKDEIQHDEYAQKASDTDKVDESEQKEEAPTQDVPTEEEPETPPEDVEIPPEITQPEEPELQEIEKEQEVEVQQEIEKEAPPKETPEDDEPDAEKFDQNLFDVRKLYKRPAEDKLRQEEMAKVKDAIDRCLTSYRKIKQEELDERDRREAQRRRKEDVKRRAAAFRAKNAQLHAENGQVYIGTGGFEREIIAKQEEFRKVHKELFVNRNERLDLSDDDLINIRKSIEEMERLREQENNKPHINFAGENIANDTNETVEENLPIVNLEEELKRKEENKKREALRLKGSRNLLGGYESATREFAYEDKRKNRKPKAELQAVTIKPISGANRNTKVAITDENRVRIGGISINIKMPTNLLDTFADQRVYIGTDSKKKSSTAKKPPKKAEPKLTFTDFDESGNEITLVEDVQPLTGNAEVESVKSAGKAVSKPRKKANNGEAKAVKSVDIADVEKKNEDVVMPKIRISKEVRDPWALSGTTLNQKYDAPSGKVRNLAKIDERKVSVGESPIKDRDTVDVLDDTFGDQRADLGIAKNKKPKTDKQ